MTYRTSRRRALQLGLAASLATPAVARAQQGWPPATITWLNPFPAGGGTDVFARPLAAQVGEQLGCQIIIDNKGGAGGTVGASQAAKMKPDGSVFFVGAIHHTIAPSIYKSLDYDLEKDFMPITMIALVPQVISINPSRVPVNTASDFIAYVKKNPGKVNYASPGAGTAHHLAGELFKLETKTDITHVPYRGAGPAMQDLLAGNADMMFDGMGTSAAQIRAKRLIGLAVATPQRNARVPRHPDGGRDRRAQLDRLDLVRPVGHQGHAAADRRSHACRGREGAGRRPSCRRSGRTRRRRSAASRRPSSPSASAPRSRNGRRSSPRPE